MIYSGAWGEERFMRLIALALRDPLYGVRIPIAGHELAASFKLISFVIP
jgi:hypothetical protein